MKRIITVIIAIIALQINGVAQDYPNLQAVESQTYAPGLDPGFSKMLQLRAKEKVGQMLDNISSMADKSKQLNVRQYYRKKALNLFVGAGEPYSLGGEQNTGVKMFTTSLMNKRPRPQLMKKYFTNLINIGYSQVKITGTDILDMDVSDLRKIDDDLYVCSVCFVQKFTGYRSDGTPRYEDRTRKEATVYVRIDDTPDGREAIVMLGDVQAHETY